MQGKFKSSILIQRLSLVLVALVFSISGFTQDVLELYGSAKDQSSSKKLEGVTVTILKNGSEYDSYTTTSNGKYDFQLPLGFNYSLVFSKADYVKKVVEVDTRGIPAEDMRGGFKQDITVSVFAYVEGFDTSIMDTPMGKMSFDPVRNSLEYDETHTQNMFNRIEAEFDRLEDLEKNRGKLLKQFEDLVKKGDDKARGEKYEDAISNFQAAIDIFTDDDDQFVHDKLADAQAKLDALNAGKANQENYDRLVAEGEKNIKKESYEEAKNNFLEAAQLMPDERLPQDKLKEIEDLLNAAKNRKDFDELVADGDRKFKNEDYGVSIEKYEAALKLLPDEQYPRDQIREAQRLLDALLASAMEAEELEKKYQDLITLGAKNLEGENYEDALRQYEEASALKDKEQLPKDKIAEIQGILDRLAAEEADRLKNDADNAEKDRIDKEYQALIDTANEQFDSEQYEEARRDYVAASSLKETEKFPKSRIQRIDEILAERDKEAADALLAEQGADREAERKALEEADRLERERKQKEIEDEKQRLLDEEADRLAEINEAKRKKEEEELKRRAQYANNASSSTEDKAENFYRNARYNTDQSKDKGVAEKKEAVADFHRNRKTESEIARKENALAAEEKGNQLKRIYRDGESARDQLIVQTQKEKDDEAKYIADHEWKSKDRRDSNLEDSQEKGQTQQRLAQKDDLRADQVADMLDYKRDINEQQGSFVKKGNTLASENEYDVNKKHQQQKDLTFEGEKVRRDYQDQTEDVKQNFRDFTQDSNAAANERLAIAMNETEDKFDQFREISDGKESLSADNSYSVNKKKEDQQFFLEDKASEDEVNSKNARADLFAKDSGQPRSLDDYKLPEGAENLEEGVSEKSFEEGNRTVIVRTVRVGQKVDEYRKVIGASGIYYFKNNKSITRYTWKRETLDAFE